MDFVKVDCFPSISLNCVSHGKKSSHTQCKSHNIDLIIYMNIHVCTVAGHTLRLCIPEIRHSEQTHTHQDADFSSCPSLLTLPCGAQFCIIKCSGEMNTESRCKTHVQYSCSFFVKIHLHVIPEYAMSQFLINTVDECTFYLNKSSTIISL